MLESLDPCSHLYLIIRRANIITKPHFVFTIYSNQYLSTNQHTGFIRSFQLFHHYLQVLLTGF